MYSGLPSLAHGHGQAVGPKVGEDMFDPPQAVRAGLYLEAESGRGSFR